MKDLQDFKLKLEKNERPLDLLFMWVKQNHVTCKDFKELLKFIDNANP